MSACPIVGTATVRRHIDDALEWVHADDQIHVTDELLADPGALAHLTTKYRVGEPCHIIPGTHHAIRIAE